MTDKEIKTWQENWCNSPLGCQNANLETHLMQQEINELRAALAKPERCPVEAWEAYSNSFDTFGDDWQDMGSDQYFHAGWNAALGIKEKPLFAELIAAHEGLAEELRAVDNIKEAE
jgi:hypothetical protein